MNSPNEHAERPEQDSTKIDFTALDIRMYYLSLGFRDVLVTDAYDIFGKPLVNMRAVYIKNESEN